MHQYFKPQDPHRGYGEKNNSGIEAFTQTGSFTLIEGPDFSAEKMHP